MENNNILEWVFKLECIRFEKIPLNSELKCTVFRKKYIQISKNGEYASKLNHFPMVVKS